MVGLPAHDRKPSVNALAASVHVYHYDVIGLLGWGLGRVQALGWLEPVQNYESNFTFREVQSGIGCISFLFLYIRKGRFV